ncbi:MAG TPA: ATP-dependent zinc metalloprotease FtsH [bacterium]|nr:ATP-dependent zinc metalloprotease FtsH [bacterium]HQL62836.1 ATP-dependent zinc metalloprotease FtsH [bacterium]
MFNRTVLFYGLLLIVIIVVVHLVQETPLVRMKLDQFDELLDGKGGVLTYVVVSLDSIQGKYDPDGPDGTEPEREFQVHILPEYSESIRDRLATYKKEINPSLQYEASTQSSWLFSAFLNVFPVLLLIGVWFFILRQMQIGGTKAMSFGKSRARLQQEGGPKVTFDDVAGCDEAKEELQEVVEFLKDPQKFQRLGGKIPRGVLLHGPPGTGKTLLARAVAGEANVPFFSISGSDFVEMFVGVGASRVRDLFEQGKKHAPCLIFMDEIDAVGRQRFAGVGGGHDEREQTLNQLLVEMDGFNSNDEVILIAATNRPDVLDPALLRPGRFDRQIVVDSPDLKGREAIFKVHTRNVVLARNVDLALLARRTPGFSGADIKNAVNEAALLAARLNKNAVDMSDFEEAIERVTAGPERRSRAINDREKRIVAYHEAGHAVVMHFLKDCDPVHKVSILPRGRALGYTMHLPTEDRYLTTKTELLSRMAGLLGGRVAEELVFGDVNTGAQNDLERVTNIAHKMVCQFGMSEKLGPLTFGVNENQIFLGRDFYKDKDYSEEIAFEIDKEVRHLVDECHAVARSILETHRDRLDALATALLEREVLQVEEVKAILGPGAHAESADEENQPVESRPVAEKSAIVSEKGSPEDFTQPSESEPSPDSTSGEVDQR